MEAEVCTSYAWLVPLFSVENCENSMYYVCMYIQCECGLYRISAQGRCGQYVFLAIIEIHFVLIGNDR
jgi:hypothetical protein